MSGNLKQNNTTVLESEEDEGDEDNLSHGQLFYYACECMERAMTDGLTNENSESIIRLLITAQQLGIYESQIV